MVNKITRCKVSVLLLSSLILVLSLSVFSVLGLNAMVGNGKFVISNATVGEVIERSIKVYNNNSFDVRIELYPSGNLTEYILIKDNNITMKPYSERLFGFSVKVPNLGKNDGGVTVTFIPADEINGKNGIALPTTMTIFATKESLIDPKTNTNSTGGDDPKISENSLGIVGILLLITAIIFIVLVILMFLYSKRKNGAEKREKLNTKKSRN